MATERNKKEVAAAMAAAAAGSTVAPTKRMKMK